MSLLVAVAVIFLALIWYMKHAGIKQTINAFTEADLKRSGDFVPESKIGIYASDMDSYRVFRDLFQQVFNKIGTQNRYEKVLETVPMELPKLNDPNRKVKSLRIRIARNIVFKKNKQATPFMPGMNAQNIVHVENVLKSTLNQIDGTYYSLDHAIPNSIPTPHCNDKFSAAAGIYRFWPSGRGVFHSSSSNATIWINEEDHLRFSILFEESSQTHDKYMKLLEMVNRVEEQHKYAFDSTFGYLCSCPSNCGTGLRFSMHVQLNNVPQHQIQSICDKHNLSIRGTNGEHTEVVQNLFDISNKFRMGVSEASILELVLNGVQELLDTDQSNNP